MIAETMGGTVNVKSELGEGSIFSITFKLMCKVPSNKILDFLSPVL